MQKFVQAEESVGTLFRGNTLASKAMDQYMKLMASEYMQSTIGEELRALCEDRRSCEMDQTRGGKPAEGLKVLSIVAEPWLPLVPQREISGRGCGVDLRHRHGCWPALGAHPPLQRHLQEHLRLGRGLPSVSADLERRERQGPPPPPPPCLPAALKFGPG
jgi:hypothetical protein